jgi:hypothetical protein
MDVLLNFMISGENFILEVCMKSEIIGRFLVHEAFLLDWATCHWSVGLNRFLGPRSGESIKLFYSFYSIFDDKTLNFWFQEWGESEVRAFPIDCELVDEIPNL